MSTTANTSSDWIDVSLTIHTGMAHWPDNPAVKIEPSLCLAHGDVCNVSKLTLGSHTGTHVDGLNHFIKGGLGIDKMPLDATIGRAKVIGIEDTESIKVAEIEPHNLQAGDRVLFKTVNSERCYQQDEFVGDFVYISTEAAEYLAKKSSPHCRGRLSLRRRLSGQCGRSSSRAVGFGYLGD